MSFSYIDKSEFAEFQEVLRYVYSASSRVLSICFLWLS